MDQGNILVVKVPGGEGVELPACRDYIIESLQKGVVVLNKEWDYTLEVFPGLGPVIVDMGADMSVIHNAAVRPAAEADQDVTALLRESGVAARAEEAERAEKQRILQRLRDYRAANGLGCLAAVAAKTRSRGAITATVLRDVLNSHALLPMEGWRKIDRALDRLAEVKETEAAQSDG